MRPGLSLQSLPRQQALLCLDVEKFITSHVGNLNGKTFLLAVSGGADSVAMAMIFYLLAARWPMHLHVCCVDHCLRAESTLEQEFVNKLCESLNMGFHPAKADIRSLAQNLGCGLEEAGRKARYDCLQKLAAELGASHICTAHHAGDLAEDMIMRLVRGCGWPALGGFSALNGNILRPLLNIRPEKLKILLQACGQDWVEDESNQSRDFRRNRIRHDVLPMLKKENPSLEDNFLRLHEMAVLDNQFWGEYMAGALKKNPWKQIKNDKQHTIELSAALLDMPKAGRLRLYLMALDTFHKSGHSGQARADTFFSIDKAWTNKNTGKIFQLPGGVSAQIKSHAILWHYDQKIFDINKS